jgi:hypothetical protein
MALAMEIGVSSTCSWQPWLILIDMNIPSNLTLYSDLVRFQVDLSRAEIRFSNPDHLKQRILQALAHQLGLEFEYFQKEARISRPGGQVLHETSASCTRPELPGSPQTSQDGMLGISSAATVNDTSDLHSVEDHEAPWRNQWQSTEVDTLGYGDSGFFSDTGLNWTDNVYTPTEGTEGLEISDLGEFIELESSSQQNTEAPQLQRPYFLEVAPYPSASVNVEHQGEPDTLDLLASEFNPRTYSGLAPSSEFQNHEDFLQMPEYEDFGAALRKTSSYSTRQSGSRGVSRAGSISSMHSEIGRSRISKVISRRSSVQSKESTSGYQELVFDSNLSRTVSWTSASSGRRGPLGTVARAAMNAVKAVGSCWRCKFLRKQVNLSWDLLQPYSC